MTRLHITREGDGTWMMSFEDEQGELRRITSHHLGYRHLVADALESVENGKYPGATIIIEAPPSPGEAAAEEAVALENLGDASERPAPRRARI